VQEIQIVNLHNFIFLRAPRRGRAFHVGRKTLHLLDHTPQSVMILSGKSNGPS
jgi:hypothetical protein